MSAKFSKIFRAPAEQVGILQTQAENNDWQEESVLESSSERDEISFVDLPLLEGEVDLREGPGNLSNLRNSRREDGEAGGS